MNSTFRDWPREIRGWAITALVIGLFGAAIWYIATTPYEANLPENFRVSFGLMVIGIMLVVFLLASSSFLDQFNWHGPLPVEVAEGYAWRRSIRSRLEGLGTLGWLVFSHQLVFMPYAAWQHHDWGRLAVSGLILAGFAYIILLAFAGALSTKAVFTIDSRGFRGLGVPGGDMSWDRIERLTVGGRLEAREVTLYELGKDGGLGPAHSIGLAAAGISARSFLAKVSEFAPHIEVTSPASRMADFSAA
jgi:hypothetical protein